MSDQKRTGVVRWFSARKGYGFIEPQEGDKDVFVHYTGIQMEGYKVLKAEDKVEFNLKEHPKGYIAIDVIVLESKD